MRNLFEKAEVDDAINRINALNPESKPLWGKMSVGQLMAHLCVPYEYVYDNKHEKPKGIKKFLLKILVKEGVVGEKPYKKNIRTAPDFLMREEKNFEAERNRLIDYILKTQGLGGDYFDGKESHSFGKLNKKEWNTMFYKHLDHHLSQFGV